MPLAVKELIMYVELPKYLDDYIFQELKGYFQSGRNVDVNLNNDDLANRKYIGTYFPRSLVESFFILADLNEHKEIKKIFESKNELNILDVGAGTGGSFLGVAHFLKKIGITTIPVNFYTIEGNANAIEYQKKFIAKFNKEFNLNYNLIAEELVFNSKDTFKNQLELCVKKLGGIRFDLLITFKFLSEFYNNNYDLSIGTYYTFAELAQNMITEDGFIIILDLVSGSFDRSIKRPYTTQILSTELNEFINSDSSKLSYILPICCGFWASKCDDPNCFVERKFEIKHSQKEKDITKVAYRVLVNKKFSQKILADIEEKEQYQISYNQYHPRKCQHGKTIEINSPSNLPTAYRF